MSLEKIAEHIEKETDTRVKKIVLEAQMKANSLLNSADETVNSLAKEAKEKAKMLAEEKRNVETAKTNVERTRITKNAISGAFKDSINNLYKAEEKFSESKEYERLIPLLIKQAKETIGEDAVIYLNKEDIEKFGKKEKNTRLSKKKMFGVYSESNDGKISVDLSINKIIQDMGDKIAEKLIKELER